MSDTLILSPIAAAKAELRADPTVAALTTRIRMHMPQGKLGTTGGDVQNAGAYVRFVVLSYLDNSPAWGAQVRHVTLGMRCYGTDAADAERLYLACEAVLLNRRARKATSGLGVWHSSVSGGTYDQDPTSQQPLFYGVVNYPTTIGSVEAS